MSQAPLWLIVHVTIPPYHTIIVPSGLCVLHTICYWIGCSCLWLFVRWVSCSFITWPSFIMLYHPFSYAMSYAPMFTQHWTSNFPMTIFSLCPCWFIHSHDPLHFWTSWPIMVLLLFYFTKWSQLETALPANSWPNILILHTLFDAFVSLLLCYL